MTHGVVCAHHVAEDALAGRRGSRRALERIKKFLGCLLGQHSMQTEEFPSHTPSPPQSTESLPPREESSPPLREESPSPPLGPGVPVTRKEKLSKKQFDTDARSSHRPPEIVVEPPLLQVQEEAEEAEEEMRV